MAEWSPEANAIFLQALEVADPDERRAYLDAACGAGALRARVERLLEADGRAGSFLEGPATDLVPGGEEPAREGPGALIGPYKLLQQIGEGGMGTVWMAEQTEPVQRKVALKVIRPGLDSRQVVARFEAERQALALMDHPSIAKVLDGGATEEGRPYFVMELVKGAPITTFCDERRLTPRERLGLFVPVCRALQHAHTKGVIHRDLKPSNVLVALYDGRPVTKVIDFGVAKATAQKLTERTLFTEFGSVVGTLEYMSPEQAEPNQLDVDTRSDVYSLGVLLYQLLTGTTPLERNRLRGTTLLEALRLIREEEPPRPSARLSTAEGLPAIATDRGLGPRGLSDLVRGELDWIVMKALEKDRNRRYQSALAFADDVARYLADEPVQACPPSAGYRLRKLVRRHKRALATAAVLGLTLLVALGAVAGSAGWVLRDRGARQAKLAGDMQLALQRGELLQEQGKRFEALAALEHAELLAGEAAPAPALRGRLAALRGRLDAEARDEDFVARFEAIRLREQSRVNEQESRFALEAAFPEVRQALQQYGIAVGVTPLSEAVARVQGRPADVQARLLAALHECLAYAPSQEAEARRWLVEVLNAADDDPWRAQLRQAWVADDGPAFGRLAGRAEVRKQPPSFLLWVAHRLPPGAGPTRLEMLRRAQQTYPADFWANHGLAAALREGGRPAEAVRYYTAALALRPDNPGVYLNRADALRAAGDLDGALADLRQAVARAPRYAMAHDSLGLALWDKGDEEGAVAAYRRALVIDPKLATAHNNLGHALSARGDQEGAAAALRQALALDPEFAQAHNNLGIVLGRQGDREGAVAAYHRATELGPRRAPAHFNLGIALWDRGDREGAIAAYRRATEIDPSHALAHLNLGVALRAAGDGKGAVVALRRAVELSPRLARAHANLASALLDAGEVELAVAACRRAIDLDPRGALAHNTLGNARWATGDREGAASAYRRALELNPQLAAAHYNLGNALRRQRDLKGAAAAYRRAVAIDPAYTLAHLNLGNVLLSLKDHKGAIPALRRALEFDPHNARVHNSLGVALRAAGDLKGAVAACLRAVELAPQLAEAQCNLGLALRADGDLKGAVAAYRRALELDPRYALAHYNMGFALRDQGDREGAIAAFRRAVAVKPQFAPAHYNLGRALHQKGELHDALTAYQEAVRLQPDNAQAREQLQAVAWLLASPAGAQVRDPEQALALVRQISRLSPRNAAYWSTLGAAYYRAGDWKASVAALEKSMELRQGGDGFDWFFLAMARWQLGEKGPAREWYERAARWTDRHAPNSQQLQRFRAEAAALLKREGPSAKPEAK
jgi:tetratricopeptide (TPR) repeat protein/serine/threonine protein kinase